MKCTLRAAYMLIVLCIIFPCHGADTVRWGFGWFSDSTQAPGLNNTSLRIAYTIFPTQSLSITRVGIYAGATRLGSPVYRLGIQGNSVSNFPDGVWVGGAANYGTTAMPAVSAWNWVDLPAAANLPADTRYHIVLEVQSADANNYATYVAQIQSPFSPYRNESGIYDELVGREYYSGTTWTRGNAFPILALDTNASLALGQPYAAGWYQTVRNGTRAGQTFTLTVPAPSGRHRLQAMGMRVRASQPKDSGAPPFPEGDCWLTLQRASDNAILASQVIVRASALGAATNNYLHIMTNLNTEVKLEQGQSYRIFIYSPDTSSGYYRIAAPVGLWSNTVPAAAAAQFQGGQGCAVNSADGTTWSRFLYTSMDADTFFMLDLEPITTSGTLVQLR